LEIGSEPPGLPGPRLREGDMAPGTTVCGSSANYPSDPNRVGAGAWQAVFSARIDCCCSGPLDYGHITRLSKLWVSSRSAAP
jgi:hypothetical protein